MKIQTKITMLLFVLFVIGCSKQEDDTPVIVESNAKQLTSFVFNAADNAALSETITANISESAKTALASVPAVTELAALTPSIQVSEKATVSPSGAQNFSVPVTYTVTAEDGSTAAYIVSLEKEAPIASLPTISFENTTIEATFFQAGVVTPTVAWNGDQGTIQLTQDIQGLSINEVTGSLTWTNQLPAGTHTFEVVAVNSAGNQVVNIEIVNTLQGVFTGTYSGSSFFEFEFYTDGTVDLRVNDETNPSLASGTWSRTGDELLVNYAYEDGDEYSTKGTLDQDPAGVIYEGEWYSGHDAISGNEGGIFEIILD